MTEPEDVHSPNSILLSSCGIRGNDGSAAGGTVHGVDTGTGAAARLVINAPAPAVPACPSPVDAWRIQFCNRTSPVAALHPHAHPHDIPPQRAGDHGGTTRGTIIHNGLAGRTGVGIYTEPVTTTDTAYCEEPADHLEIQKNRLLKGDAINYALSHSGYISGLHVKIWPPSGAFRRFRGPSPGCCHGSRINRATGKQLTGSPHRKNAL